MSIILPIDGLACGQRDKPDLQFDHPHEYAHDFFERSVGRLSQNRAEMESELADCIRRRTIPRSAALLVAVGAMSTAEKLTLLDDLVERDLVGFDDLAAVHKKLIRAAAWVCADADELIARFALGPSRINPADLDAAVHALEDVIVQLLAQKNYETKKTNK